MSNTINMHFEEISPSIRNAGQQDQKGWKNKSRKIYDHEFLYCLKGRAYIIIESIQYEITPNTLVLIKPNKAHSLWMDEDNPADILWIHFDFIYRNDMQNLSKLLTNSNGVQYKESLPWSHYLRSDPLFENGFVFPEIMKIKHPASLEVENIFKRIIKITSEAKGMWQLDCRIELLKLLRIIIKDVSDVNLKNDMHKGEKQKIALIVADYIHKNYQRKLMLGEIAEVLNLHEDYVGKIFKKETGECFTLYANRFRVQRAKELMIATELSIDNISELVGFSDVYYFTKVMKKIEGITPGVWRKCKNETI